MNLDLLLLFVVLCGFENGLSLIWILGLLLIILFLFKLLLYLLLLLWLWVLVLMILVIWKEFFFLWFGIGVKIFEVGLGWVVDVCCMFVVGIINCIWREWFVFWLCGMLVCLCWCCLFILLLSFLVINELEGMKWSYDIG